MSEIVSFFHRLAKSEQSTFLRFVAVGLLSNIANFVTYIGCVELRVSYFYAALIGYMVGLVNSFILGRFFVFSGTSANPARPLHLTIFLFLVVYGTGGLIMAAGVNFGVVTLGLPSILSWLAVAAFVVFWNYLGSKLIVFKGTT